MKITVDMDSELEHALELHLSEGTSMQAYMKAAVRFFKDMYLKEKEGRMIGFGDKSRFASYNTEASPFTYLETLKRHI